MLYNEKGVYWHCSMCLNAQIWAPVSFSISSGVKLKRCTFLCSYSSSRHPCTKKNNIREIVIFLIQLFYIHIIHSHCWRPAAVNACLLEPWPLQHKRKLSAAHNTVIAQIDANYTQPVNNNGLNTIKRQYKKWKCHFKIFCTLYTSISSELFSLRFIQ